MSHLLDHNSTGYQNESKGVEVFVGGLARSLTEEKVHKLFSTCGEIMEMRLIKDPQGGLKGFGFVRFTTKAAADKALKDLNETMLEGKKIGVLPSAGQDTLFLGNLNKGWSVDDFNNVVRQVFPDIVSIELSQPDSNNKFKNRGFGFVKFSSHAVTHETLAAARAFRAGSMPNFVLGGSWHPSVKWAEVNPEVDENELAKIKIAFVRNLPSGTDENYLKLLFAPFGQVEKVVVHKKGNSSVGFVHFTLRSHLDFAIAQLNDKIVQGPNGGPSVKLHVEVARPMDKKRKRIHEDQQSIQSREIFNKFQPQFNEPVLNSSNGHEETFQKELVVADSHEAAVLMLPVAVRERLLRILRLGIATRYDIEVKSLANLAELPESNAILVLDQFMLSGAEQHDKGAYLTQLISKVDKLGSNQLPLSLQGSRDTTVRESVGLTNRVQIPIVDSLTSHVDPSAHRLDSYTSRYPSLYPDYRLSSHASVARTEEISPQHMHQLPVSLSSSTTATYNRYTENLYGIYANFEEMSPNQSNRISGSSSAAYNPKPVQDSNRIPASSLGYGRGGSDPQLTPSGDRQATRPQMRFDPFTGEPYKFDPFTGEPIVQESLPPRTNYENYY
ncbi:uncharacterized protein [Rutidosis leptorrhynchoides]|uniref:uncharacterized protein isoform X2 n=1 Tax=Rutidosis leptorrhynchoides TaxID=125765 RepID=UPI003A9A45F6